MTGLAQRAAEMAGRQPTADGDDQQAAPAPAAERRPARTPEPPPAPLPAVQLPEPDSIDPEQVPVHTAWARVMGDVQGIRKGEQYQGNGTRYNFRGIDRVLNAFGPACRRHGVLVLPTNVDASYRDTHTSNNKPTRECTVNVTYTIVGPAGDKLEVQSQGESLDSGDKGTSKALAVALRSLLLHGGLVPTDEPDPDSVHYERGEAPIRTAVSYRDEVLEPRTTVQRLRQIRFEVRQNNRAGEVVVNENGDDETLLALIERIGKERSGQQGGEQQ